MPSNWDDRFTHYAESFLGLGPLWLCLFLVLVPYANDYSFCWLSLMAPQQTEFGFNEPISPAKWYLGLCMILVSAALKASWFGAWLQVLITTRLCDRHWKPPNNPSTKRIMQVDNLRLEDQMFRGSIPYEEGRRPRKCPFGCPFDLSDRVYHCTRWNRCLPVYDHYCRYIRSTVYLRTLKPYCFLLFILPIDAAYSTVISLYALCDTSTRWTAPFVGSIIACSLVVFIIVLDNFIDGFRRLVLRNCVGPELGEDKWTLAFKYQDNDEYRLRVHEFEENPWDLGPMENFRQIFGQRWWTWFFFWWTSETVLRYGDYSDRDLPYADFVTREFTDQIMPRLTGVAIDLPAPSLGGEGLNRRQSALSDIERRRQQRPGDTSTNHVGMITTRYEHGNIRRLVQGHSSGHDLGP
ncbi:uncharacterized protein F4807DRAFT_472098 [Annulohypoxylon truncatum]|uniref:uncharacterized protein n=1 Tax=Annulohypoxylon truncatum TaxID=327061 RepID=UPI002007DFCD|nr:uncharacterized protein F4807DRAFT_472098 [Annulohypoxylon truncatum]KAI1204347.1 hypothetical protein F4807DRAFT_472098 [Annulohypoxylon truncatum]